MASAGALPAAVDVSKGTTALSRLNASVRPACSVLHVAGQRGASFWLRWSAALRVSSLPRRAKSGDAGDAADAAPNHELPMVYQVLSRECEHSLALLSRVSIPPEEKEAAAALREYFTRLGAAAAEGVIDKAEGVRGLITGVHRLIELVYKCFPSTPRVTTPTTEEEFINYFVTIGYQCPELSTAFAYMETMGKYPDSIDDQSLLSSMITSMNLARVVVNGMTMNMDALQQLPPVADLSGFAAPVLPLPADVDQSLVDGMGVPQLQMPSDAADPSPSDGMGNAGASTGTE